MIILDNTRYGERQIDLRTKLFDNRCIFLTGKIDPIFSEEIINQLMILNSRSRDDIYLYINSTGGEVISGLAIYDCMNSLNCDVSTIVLGQASSMACIILSSGTKGKRFAYPNSEIMAHTVSSGYYGKEADVEVSANRTRRLNETLMNILANNCNRTVDEVIKETEHDKFFTSNEAVEFGLVDYIIGE